jgi:hypothetical protein
MNAEVLLDQVKLDDFVAADHCLFLSLAGLNRNPAAQKLRATSGELVKDVGSVSLEGVQDEGAFATVTQPRNDSRLTHPRILATDGAARRDHTCQSAIHRRRRTRCC